MISYRVGYFEEESQPWAVCSVPYNKDHDWRSLYKHDIDEIVYQNAYRKLAQKTQVVVQPSDDTFRTRLTHTLEVAQIADNFSYLLKLNRDLTKAISYGHDIGHPPFAHVGENTLDRLLGTYVDRSAQGLGVSKTDAENLVRDFRFKHPHNSRRVLQRKTKELSPLTLKSVIGHGWSPWKGCSNKTTVEEVESNIHSTLTDDLFLPCFEAQAVALSDQIASLNSDIEDLVHLLKSTDKIREKAFSLLNRSKVKGINKNNVKQIIDNCITPSKEKGAPKRGWGRKSRLGLAVGAIISNSKESTFLCTNYQESRKNPLTPPTEMAIALDILERAIRNFIYTNPDIRLRDAIAESATTFMFHAFLTLEFNIIDRNSKHLTDSLAKNMKKDYENWRCDYITENLKEMKDENAYSFPRMKKAGDKITDFWKTVSPAIFVIDYISEMTDRFVVHKVFSGHPLQEVLHAQFDRGFLNEQNIQSN
jgi:dGTP triphosphohydrolase